MWCLALVAAAASAAAILPLAPIAADRSFTVLDPDADLRDRMRDAGERLGSWTITVAGVPLDGPRLTALAATNPRMPFARVVREELRRPFDLDDLLLYLDDVLAAGDAGRRGEPFVLPMGRARSEGVLVHPQEVWDDRPRVYPQADTVAVDEPPPQDSFPAAEDGQVLGPEWTMRYRSPEGRNEQLAALAALRPDSMFAERIRSLLDQLDEQGAEVFLTSTVRYRERGYLMWGAFLLRSCVDRACVDETVTRLDAIQGTWVTVPIVWAHPDGWEATREAARQMADAFDVVYATEEGARKSNHYDGIAVDVVAVGLPGHLKLRAPDGARRTFELSGTWETRDLSLTPALVKWIEQHWDLKKLRDDYPHWDDEIRRRRAETLPDRLVRAAGGAAMDIAALAKQTFIIAVLFIPFGVGLQSRPNNALTLVRDPSRGLRAFVALFVVMPVVALGLCLVADMPRPANGALIALSVAPMLPTLHMLLGQVGCDRRYAVGLEVSAALTSLVMVPLWFWIVSRIIHSAIPVELDTMVLSLVKGLFVPLAVGMVINALSKGRSEAIGPKIVTFATLVVIACGLTLMWHHRAVVMEQMQWQTLVVIFLFVVTGLTVGHLLGGPEPGNRAALALATSGRHVGMSIAIVHTVMPDLMIPTVATLLGYALLRPLIAIPYTRRAKALHKAAATA